jgi:bifunctional non-homologous end joining protein LigD
MSTQMVGIEISKPDKELFPESDRGAAVTKLDLALYYESVAQVMLPHLRGRPVNMERFPDGIEKSSFYEKRVPAHSPTSCTPPRSPRPRADSDRSSWTTSAAWSTSPSRPASRRTPGSAGQTLSSTPICSWSTSTRRCPVSRGYHAVVPLRRTESFDDVRAFARDSARVLVDREPDQHTIRSIGRRLARGGDRWADLPKGQSLGRARQKLRRLGR